MARVELHDPPYQAVQRLVVWAATQWGHLDREVWSLTGTRLADIELSFAVSWLHQRMDESAPGGPEDVAAYLEGRELPSLAREREQRPAVLAAMGAEVH